MNKPSQCRCPFQLISDICQCHISPRNPSVINHLQQRSHSHLGISEHAEGKVILLMSLFFQIFTGLCLGERGTRDTDLSGNANKSSHCPGTNTQPRQSRRPTHSCPHRFGSLPHTCLPMDKRASPLQWEVPQPTPAPAGGI